MSEKTNNARSDYRLLKRDHDNLTFELNRRFEMAFPVQSKVFYRRESEGKVHVGFVQGVYAVGDNRKVLVKSNETQKQYWIGSYWLCDKDGKHYDNAR